MTEEDILAVFQAAGAEVVTPGILQPAGTLLDLYGEDIRARAFVTHDLYEGEMMLRPDFTVPVVQMHLENGVEPARYAYAGPVFRQQPDTARPREYTQVGFELFERTDPAAADAEVFALFSNLLKDKPFTPITGDIGVLIAAVDSLSTNRVRRAALRRHIWRPKRFRALLERFCKEAPVLPHDKHSPSEAPLESAPEIGLRRQAEVFARLEQLRAEAEDPPMSPGEADIINALLSLSQSTVHALSRLRDVTVDLSGLSDVVDRFEARLEALETCGIATDGLAYEGSFGRTQMEYYDGFVFGFTAAHRPDLPPIATGGRYDALCTVLGQGRDLSAVGGVIRPEILGALA